METAFKQILSKHCNSKLFHKAALNNSVNETEIRFGSFNKKITSGNMVFSPGTDAETFRKIANHCDDTYDKQTTIVLKISVDKKNMTNIHKIQVLRIAHR